MEEREHLEREHIQILLELFRTSHAPYVRLVEENPPEDTAQAEEQDVRAAYELINFMEEMPGGFLIYHADGGEEIIYANRGLMRTFLCETLEEFQRLTGNSFRGMIHPEDLEEVEKTVRQQIAASQLDLDYVEYRIVRKDGSVGWVEDYGHFVHSETVGDIFYVFLVDATDKRVRQQKERKRSEQKWRSLIEEYDKERMQINQEHLRRLEVIEGLGVNYESIFYVDLEEDAIRPYRLSSRTEPVFHENAGMAYTAFVEAYIASCVYGEDRARVAREMAPDHVRRQLTGDTAFYLNFRAVEEENVEYLQARFVNAGRKDRPCQLVMGCRRVDEELQQELEQKHLLEDALHNAKSSIVAKNTFLSNMSHDMRTPLNAIFGFTALARSSLSNPEAVAGYLDQIEHSSRQLLDLIDKVLQLSWTDSNEFRAEESPCSLRAVLGEVYDFLLPQAEEKGLSFTLDCSRVRHDAVCGDREKMGQLVMYLANNAVTYTRPGGSVTLTAAEGEELSGGCSVYRISVQDTGIGISEDFLHQIFEPFTRERNTTLSGIHGVGLGLTIAKNIAELLGGSIEVESVVDKGSTFTVLLRLRWQVQEEGRPVSGEEDWAGANYKILLVEDNEINLEIEQVILTNIGFSVDAAENGRIAVDKLLSAGPGAYDLVLMDIQMPVMDGWEATRVIRALPDPVLSRIPILALSANVFESDIQKSRDAGMDAHLAKPLDVPQLLRTIQGIVRKNTEGR